MRSSAGQGADPGSSDPAFLGDRTRWNPEDLLVASTSACHKLWYLHLCARSRHRRARLRGRGRGHDGGRREGRFTQIVLRPRVTVRAGDDVELARRLHHDAHEQALHRQLAELPGALRAVDPDGVSGGRSARRSRAARQVLTDCRRAVARDAGRGQDASPPNFRIRSHVLQDSPIRAGRRL